MSSRGGKITRASSRSSRRNSSAPYERSGSGRKGSSSTGLTKYMGSTSLDWSAGGAEEEEEAAELRHSSRTRTLAGKAKALVGLGKKKKGRNSGADAMDTDDGEVGARSVSTFGRALSSFKPGKKLQAKEIDLWKPSAKEILGITFEVPEDAEAYKGVVVAEIHAGGLMAKAKKLKVGDVVHAINGRPVATPQEGAAYLQDAKGVVQLVVTRANAKPKARESGAGAASGGSSRARKSSARGKEAEDDGNTTVVVSCSQLILESKKIVGEAAGLDAKLDDLYARLKGKELPSQAALKALVEMVGQTTVEQAGLVIANAQQGSLPEGWVEYFDKGSNKYYYYNVHTKTTTWHKPRKDKPPPPPPGRASKAAAPPPPARKGSSSGRGGSTRGISKRGSSTRGKAKLGRAESWMDADSDGADSGDGEPFVEPTDTNHTSQGHHVSSVIYSMAAKRKMVEAVQVECPRAPRHGPAGLQSVSL